MNNAILRYFECEHLPKNLRDITESIRELAHEFEATIADSAEKSAGLRKLLEAKDCFVRAALPPVEVEDRGVDYFFIADDDPMRFESPISESQAIRALSGDKIDFMNMLKPGMGEWTKNLNGKSGLVVARDKNDWDLARLGGKFRPDAPAEAKEPEPSAYEYLFVLMHPAGHPGPVRGLVHERIAEAMLGGNGWNLRQLQNGDTFEVQDMNGDWGILSARKRQV